MRTNNRILFGALAVAGTAMVASAGIVGSAHDFSSYAWSDHQICKPCHTPHFAMAGLPRLWNHELTTATYTMHDGTGTAVDDFDVPSRLCLSCHDGTVALDNYGGNTSGTNFIPTGQNLTTDLSDDHPLGSEAQYPPDPKPTWWDGAFVDASLLPRDVSLEPWTDTGGVTHEVVSCVTCHNPHNADNFDPLLNISNDGSALCLTCHIK